MIKTQVKLALILLAVLLLLSGAGTERVLAYADEVNIVAGRLDYDPDTGIINAAEWVILKNEDYKIQAERIIYHQDGLVEAEQGVTFSSADYTIRGERLHYSLSTEEGEMTGVKGSRGNIYFSGASGRLFKEKIQVQAGSYSKCSLDTQCISFWAKDVTIKGDRIKTNGGWLRIKGLKILPLPPMDFSTKSNENWPYVEVGYESERGLYATGTFTRALTDDLNYSYGAGIGTNSWLNLNTGLRWREGKIEIGAGYNWLIGEENTIDLRAQYRDSWGRIVASYVETWGSVEENDELYRLIVPITSKFRTEGELFYSSEDWGVTWIKGAKLRNRFGSVNTEAFYQLENDYLIKTGLKARRTVLPGLQLGIGMIGAGEERQDLHWYPEGSFNLAVKVFNSWTLTANGVYEWSEDEGWTTEKIGLTKNLHCFQAGVSYDFIEEKFQYSMGLNW